MDADRSWFGQTVRTRILWGPVFVSGRIELYKPSLPSNDGKKLSLPGISGMVCLLQVDASQRGSPDVVVDAAPRLSRERTVAGIKSWSLRSPVVIGLCACDSHVALGYTRFKIHGSVPRSTRRDHCVRSKRARLRYLFQLTSIPCHTSQHSLMQNEVCRVGESTWLQFLRSSLDTVSQWRRMMI